MCFCELFSFGKQNLWDVKSSFETFVAAIRDVYVENAYYRLFATENLRAVVSGVLKIEKTEL